MPENIDFDYGIKYKKIIINETTFLFIPIELVRGQWIGDNFYGLEEFATISSLESIDKNDILIDSIKNIRSLEEIYDIYDPEFLKEYVLLDELNKLLLVKVSKGEVIKEKIDINRESQTREQIVYEEQFEKPAVILNEDALSKLLDAKSLEAIKTQLEIYRKDIDKFRDLQLTDGINKMTLENGRITKIETNSKIRIIDGNDVVSQISKDEKEHLKEPELNTKSEPKIDQVKTSGVSNTSVSLKGLTNYITERVFGHDQEIKYIAKTILMNYTATSTEKNEPILIVGPTGTGKTETMNAVCNYLDIPMVEINSINLVPEGIKGMSLEDCLSQLYSFSKKDPNVFQKGLMFFDEFDKLGKIGDNDTKGPVIQILLKFIEGAPFSLNERYNKDIIVSTKSIIKVFAGAFSELWENSSQIGFGNSGKKSVFNPKAITKKAYFGKEVVSRIPHIFVYEELNRAEKKRYLLESKISELLLKKARYARQFNVDLIVDDSYCEAILDKLAQDEKSMRDLNNLIINSLAEVECELLDLGNTTPKKLVLTSDIVEDNKKFDLI